MSALRAALAAPPTSERPKITLDHLASLATITVPEAGEMLGIGRGAAYAAARKGQIPTLTLGRRVVVPVPKLLELLGVRDP